MMDPVAFIRSIYLGDRACKSVVADGWNSEVKVLVDSISRVRGETWNYHNAENLDDGYIVFEGVRKFDWDSNGLMPNDAFIAFTVEPCMTGESKYVFRLEIASGAAMTGLLTPVHLAVYAEAIALESRGGVRIRD